MTRRFRSVVAAVLLVGAGVVMKVGSVGLDAQAPPAAPTRPLAPEPWRRTGARPCVRSGSAFIQCVAPPGVTAVRAGRLFDSETGRMLTNQVIVITGERITAVGPEAQVKVPAGARVIDLSRATVLPGTVELIPESDSVFTTTEGVSYAFVKDETGTVIRAEEIHRGGNYVLNRNK